MGHTSRDAAYDAYLADQEVKALDEATAAADQVATTLAAEWATDLLQPDVIVELSTGADDQPLFVFSINVDLADDLPADEYPMDDLGRLATELRARVIATPVDDWAWLVDVGTKARTTYA